MTIAQDLNFNFNADDAETRVDTSDGKFDQEYQKSRKKYNAEEQKNISQMKIRNRIEQQRSRLNQIRLDGDINYLLCTLII